MKVMFDTNVFNHILDGEIPIDLVPNEWEVHGTHIQRDEINQTSDKNRRGKLLRVFDQFLDISLPTESAVWDVSSWDECKWSDEEDSLYGTILNGLNTRREKPNNVQDTLIAETAIKNNLTLVTNDGDLKKVAESHGAQVKDLRITKGSNF